jgi:protein TonB
MKTTIKNQDDIVFENRNKDYGAYFLRRSYNKIVTRALFFAVLFFLGIVSIPLIAGLKHSDKKITFDPTCPFDPRLITPPDKTELPKLPDAIKKEQIAVFKPPVIVTDPVEVNIDFDSLMDKTKNGKEPELSGDGPLIVDVDVSKSPIDFNSVETPVLIPEVYPTFIGGEDAMYKWLGNNIKYPQIARETGIQGTVIISFVVEKDGSISGIQLLKDIGGGCGEEAIRVVKLMPKWREGRQYNKPVRVPYSLPIKFTLE